MGSGAQLGSGAGFLLGTALGAFIGGGDDDTGAPDSDAFEGLATLGRSATYGIAGAVAGGVIGYVVGRRSQSEVWEPAEQGAVGPGLGGHRGDRSGQRSRPVGPAQLLTAGGRLAFFRKRDRFTAIPGKEAPCPASASWPCFRCS